MMCVEQLHSFAPGGIEPIERMLQPIPLEEFVALATTINLPIRGLQSRITKLLDDQVRRCLPMGSDFEPDLEDVGNTFPGPCKRKPSLVSTFLFPLSDAPDLRKLYLTHIIIAIQFHRSRIFFVTPHP